MQEPKALGRIVELVRDLRKRCPWDAAQTPATLRPYLVEEALELDAALGEGDAGKIRDETGDVLLHVAFQIVLGEEAGVFGPEDVVSAIEEKMWRRHPALFPEKGQEGQRGRAAERQGGGEAGEARRHPTPGASPGRGERGAGAELPTAATSATAWEKLKLRDAARVSLLDGLPPNLPELIAAWRLQERAAGVGFDWPDAEGPLAKVREETDEIAGEMTARSNKERVAEEVGDLLFATVNLARKLGVDPRAALERANGRFVARFRAVERLAAERGIDMGTAGLEVLDGLWEEVKE